MVFLNYKLMVELGKSSTHSTVYPLGQKAFMILVHISTMPKVSEYDFELKLTAQSERMVG